MRRGSGVGDAHFDRAVYVQPARAEGDAGRGVIAVDPRAQAPDGFRALFERDGPFVHELAVQTVHFQAVAGGLDCGCRVLTRGEAVLHAEDEPFDPGEDAGSVV